jgi:hypothetical protein
MGIRVLCVLGRRMLEPPVNKKNGGFSRFVTSCRFGKSAYFEIEKYSIATKDAAVSLQLILCFCDQR